jgi:ubiquinone/menaquinone biosynthesis C-methylase UbiE
MSFYNERVLPHVINLSMRNRELLPYRERVIAQATGRVLEVGVGSGLNLPIYGAQVREIIGVEPSARLISMAQRVAERAKAPVRFLAGSAESLPLDTGSVDTVVMTWTLCSIPNAITAMKEMRRVLHKDGQLLFVEHGLSPESNVQKWQNRLTPVWKTIGGGCHLNRPIRALIENGGFSMSQLDTGYMKGPKPMTYLYEGRALPVQHVSASKAF